jgi:hypothetical protein
MKTSFVKNIIKKIRSIGELFDRDKEKWAMNPIRDWLILAVFSLILIVLFAVLGYTLFFKINEGGFFTGELLDSSPPSSLEVGPLEDIINTQEKKQIMHGRLLKNAKRLVDPSL